MERDGHTFGTPSLLRFLRTVSAILLVAGLGAGLALTLTARDPARPATVDFGTGPAPGFLFLESSTDPGERPFTVPVDADLGIDTRLTALPPLSGDELISRHGRLSVIDRLLAGELGWRLSGEASGAFLDRVDSVIADFGVTAESLTDGDGDGRDDDASFTLVAGDGSAACVELGEPRVLAGSLGRAVDPVDGTTAAGLRWDPAGKCGEARPLGRALQVGSTPGVYGMSLRGEVCDLDLLVDALEGNPQVAQGWGIVHGLASDEISGFVSGLTPVVLLRDTLVTDHEWDNGRVVPRQAVLQRGSAVLISVYGSPVVRCVSGSPLLPPRALPELVDVEGRTWAGFDVGLVQAIPAADRTVSAFVLLELETGRSVERIPGRSGSRDVLAGPVRAFAG